MQIIDVIFKQAFLKQIYIMHIRTAQPSDVNDIQSLLGQLGYNKSAEFLESKLAQMLSDSTYEMLVYELDDKAVALITIHYYMQIGYEGETANIGFFVVDENVRGQSIGKLMEEYSTQVAIKRKCALIELYSGAKRLDAHRFYERQGYKSYEKFFIKELNEKI